MLLLLFLHHPMEIIGRFSSHLKEVLANAIKTAVNFNHPMVEPIHLLSALLEKKGSVGAEIINRFKVEPKTLTQIFASLPVNKNKTDTSPVTQIELTPLSPNSKKIIEKSLFLAEEYQHTYIGTEHLLATLIKSSDRHINVLWKLNNIKLADLENQIKTVLNNASQFPRLNELGEVMDKMQEGLGSGEDMGLPVPPPPTRPETKRSKNRESALDFFATNLTNREMQKNIDPVIGRDTEIERLIQILCRRTKNNPALLGDPGVGKTAIVEGLAKKIISGDVPDLLLNKKIYSLDMGLMIAGTIYRGEFEARLRQVIEEVTNNSDIILFIDEMHNIVGAGSNQGTMDAANILKPALARGQIRCIGATTLGEFKKHIENDPALERRFQPIYVKEPTTADTIEILKGIKHNYETYHQLKITDEAIVAAVRLSERYISNKFLPDKAIDLLDETAAGKRLQAKGSAWVSKLGRTKQRLEKIILSKENAARQDDFETAVKYKKEEDKIQEEIKIMKEKIKSQKTKILGTVTAKDIGNQIAKITGTPPQELILDNKEKMTSLAEKIKQYIIGQDETVTEVSELIQQAQLGLGSPNRPLASLFLVGESGVGKTELAKTISQILYPNTDALIKLDMSEFNEGFGVSKLLGSPAGYVGFREANQFTDRLKVNPYSVVLFDEIDKAHKDVTKLLLQILENGEIADATGKKISLKHAIIILTTTAGAEIAAQTEFGFGENKTKNKESKKRLIEKLKEIFSPEIINRLDTICLLNKLTDKNLEKIAELEITQLNERLKNYHTEIIPDTAVFSEIIKTEKKHTDARAIRRLVRNEVEKLIAQIILKNTPKKKYQLVTKNNQLAIR